jgi:hypothetical protein
LLDTHIHTDILPAGAPDDSDDDDDDCSCSQWEGLIMLRGMARRWDFVFFKSVPFLLEAYPIAFAGTDNGVEGRSCCCWRGGNRWKCLAEGREQEIIV